MAAGRSVINTTNHYLIISATTEKDQKRTQHSRSPSPLPDHQAQVTGTGFALTPLVGTAHCVNEQMNVYFKTVHFHTVHAVRFLYDQTNLFYCMLYLSHYIAHEHTCFNH